MGGLTALMAAGYSTFSLILNYTFQTSSYDLVIFDQAVRSYAHLQPGISVVKGLHNNFGAHFSVLGDHWSPILALLAPLYWIFNSPETLLVAQAVLFALAVPPLWLFTRRAFGGGRKATGAAYLVSVAYGLSWPIASAAAFDFHEVAFAPVLTAVALERLQAGRLRTALIALALLLLVKEDMGLFVAGIGVYLAVARPRMVSRQRLVGLALIVLGVADTWVATYLLIPAFGGRSSYYWAYGALGQNAPQVLAHIVAHPLGALRLLITPGVKLDTMLWLLAPFCLLPLLSPITIAVIPLLLERMLQNQFPNWWITAYHYNAYLVIILVCGAVDGAARLDRWVLRARQDRTLAGTTARARADRSVGTVALVSAAVMCALAVYLVPRFALGPALHPSFYQRNAEQATAAAAVAAVPAGVTVEAVNRLGPHLSGPDTVLLWDGDGGSPLYPPWVLAAVVGRQFTFHSVAQQEQRLALLRKHGYQTVFDRGGFIVMHSPGASTPVTGSAEGAG
ncbi:MAG: DUF2079 domain-containing protein [Actinomycetota bacterium]|nr:DUF2079 domain-containing protein [Actinomycetota bacterium]